MHIKMHISCRNRKQYEQRNCKTIHTQSIHRKGTVPIPPADESAGFLGTFFIEDPFMRKVRCLDKLIDDLAKGKPIEKTIPEA